MRVGIFGGSDREDDFDNPFGIETFKKRIVEVMEVMT